MVLKSIKDRKIRKWVNRKLNYANYRASAELLSDLVCNIGDFVDSLAPDRARFLDDIRNNRNFYTHRDDSRTDGILEGGELYTLTDGVICLLKAGALRRLGFSKQDTKSLMDDCQGILQSRMRVAKQYRKVDDNMT